MPDRDKILLLQQKIALFEDEQAYEELYLLYFNPLMHFVYSFTRSKQLSEEIVSDVFINLWERRKKLETIDNLTFYLYTSAKNISLNYLKKIKRERMFSIDDPAVLIRDRDVNPEQLMITAELLKKIQEAIRELPPKCKLIYQLVKEDGLKYREAAKVLNLSLKTVEAQMAIAMKRIYEAVSFSTATKVIRQHHGQ